MPDADLQLEPPEAAATCAVCADRLEVGPARACPRCETPHHAECWEYNEGCARYGCKAALTVVREQAAAVLPAQAAAEDPAEAPGLALRLAMLPPAAWRALGGALLFVSIGLITQLASLQGFFGFLSLLVMALPVLALVLLIMADWLPNLFRQVAQDRVLPELEETPLKRLEARLAEDPKNAHLLEMVAFGCYADERFEDALELYGRLRQLQPGNFRVAYQGGKCLERLGRWAEARDAFQELVDEPAFQEVHEKSRFWVGVLARRLEEGGEPAAAAATAQE